MKIYVILFTVVTAVAGQYLSEGVIMIYGDNRSFSRLRSEPVVINPASTTLPQRRQEVVERGNQQVTVVEQTVGNVQRAEQQVPVVVPRIQTLLQQLPQVLQRRPLQIPLLNGVPVQVVDGVDFLQQQVPVVRPTIQLVSPPQQQQQTVLVQQRPVVQDVLSTLPTVDFVQDTTQTVGGLPSLVFPGAQGQRPCSFDAPGLVDVVYQGRAYHFSWCHRAGRLSDSQHLNFTWFEGNIGYHGLGDRFQLVSIEDGNEDLFIAAVIYQYRLGGIWTSGFLQQARWRWGSLRNTGYTNWFLNKRTGETQPDNANGNEFCLAVVTSGLEGFGWHDQSCDNQWPVVYETAAFYGS